MRSAYIYDDFAEIFADVFAGERINFSPMLTPEEVPGWDSFKQVQLILAAEKHWGIKFRVREVDQLRSVSDFCDIISEKTSKSHVTA